MSSQSRKPIGSRAVAGTAAGAMLLLTALSVGVTPAGAAPTSSAPACAGKVDDHVLSGHAADVIVAGVPGAQARVAASVRHAGGRVLASEPLIDGVLARLSGHAARTVGCSSAVVSVTPNRSVHFQSKDGAGDGAGSSPFVDELGADSLGSRGKDGARVGVAVIDTGISPMADVAGRIVYGPDLSGEGSIIDSYGHGTVMGGIIAGNGRDSR